MFRRCSVVCFLFIILIGIWGVHADQSVGKAVVELWSDDVIPVDNGHVFTIPLVVSCEVSLAGAQFRLHFDAGHLVPREPVLTDRSGDMTLVHAVHGDEMIVLVYSTAGGQIAPGSGPVLNIPCAFMEKGSDICPLSVEEVILADAEARSIPAVVRTNTMSDGIQTPTQYRLVQNYPNPFNPTTDIRYQIVDNGFPVHTTLRVYNVLGQEVRTLVDTPLNAGYYTVTWDGNDRFGSQVASGIYFCRLEAEAYAASMRMVMMK